MFGSKKVSEADRLRAVYTDQSDSELLRLDREREDLTDAAREMLADVMKQRGLSQHSERAPAAETHAEERTSDAGEVSSEIGPNEAVLCTLWDVMELRETIRVLESAGIPLRVLDETESPDGTRSRGQLFVSIVVERSRLLEAQTVTREQLPFFAYLSVSGAPDVKLTPPEDWTLLLLCDRADALTLVPVLSSAGVSFSWRDGREDDELPDENTIAFEVRSTQREKADAAVRSWTDKNALSDR